MKKEVTLSTGVLGFIFGGVYESWWGEWVSDFDYDICYCDDEELAERAEYLSENGYCDYKRFTKDVCEHINDSLSNYSYVPWISFDGEVKSVYSPAYYNYSTDSFSFGATVDVKELIEFLKSVINGNYVSNPIKDFWEDNWKSCSGFISYMPEINEIYEMIFDTDIEDLTLDNISDLASLGLEMEREVNGEFKEFEIRAFEDWSGNNSIYEYYEEV